MRGPDLRLAVPAACAWVVVAVVIGMPPAAVPALVAFWLAAGALTVLAFSRRRLALVALACAAAALCCTSVALQSAARQPSDVPSRAVQVTALTTETLFPGRGNVGVSVISVDGVSTSFPARVFGEGSAERVGIGSTLSIVARLVATDPGEDVSFLLFSEGSPQVVSQPPWFLAWADSLRVSFGAATERLEGDGGDLLAGLAIGDTSAVSDELDRAMKVSSLSHLTAVSGANCAIVIGLVLAAGGAVGVPRGVRIAVSIGVLVAFVVLVTPEPSVVRAAVMATLVLVSMASGRPVRGVAVLSLASIALLVFDPWLARNYGFVLSVLATAGLLLLAAPLSRWLGRWLPRWLAVVIAVPLAAQLACQPVIILLNASIPTYGVIANLLAEPAAPIATIVGLAACVLLVVVPPLGELLCRLAWLPSSWIAGVAQFFARLPAAQLPWVAGWVGVLLLAVMSLLVVAALRHRWAALSLVVVLVMYLGLTAGSRVAQQVTRPAHWQIAMCDVGQGDATVVRSAGQVALIDTGAEPQLIEACLSTLGISRIDLLVLTHFDLDHVGGASAVVGRVSRVFVGPSADGGDDRLVADLVAGGAVVERVSRGLSGLLGELRFTLLWPPARLGDIEPGNEASVVVEFEAVGACLDGCLSSVFLADLGESAQERLTSAHPLGPVDVVKVSHHGSADQSDRLYARLNAVVGIIGVGADNGYGHPTDRLLDILVRSGTQAVRTDEHGLILLAPGGERSTVSVWTER